MISITEKDIGRELRSLTNLIKRYIDSDVIKQQFDNVTGNNGWIIGYMADHDDHDIYQKEIEKAFGITRSTTSKVIDLMEKKELIIRESVEGDKRLRKLVLTSKAYELNKMISEGARKFEEQLINGFTDEEIQTLRNYIERMKKNISEK